MAIESINNTVTHTKHNDILLFKFYFVFSITGQLFAIHPKENLYILSYHINVGKNKRLISWQLSNIYITFHTFLLPGKKE